MLNRSPTSSLVKQFVGCGVIGVHFGQSHRIDDDGCRISGAICSSTGSPYPVVLFSRHQYERAPAMACDLDACLLRVGDVALCRYSIKSLELSAAKFLSRNTRSAATSHLSQSTTSVRSAKNSRLKSKFVPSFLTARSILPGFAPIASTDRLRAARDAGRGQGGERRAERLRRMAMEKSYIMSMDAGGTMTDTFFVDKSRRFVVGKAQTTPQDESVGFAQSCVDALKQWDTKPEDIFPQVQTGIYSGTSMLNPLLEPKR